MIGIKRRSLCLLLGMVFISFASNVWGESEIDKTLSPYFFIENGDPETDHFPLKNTKVTVNITGVIADVTVTQQYTNNGTRPINARYIFPASTRAAVHGMEMKIGQKLIYAKIKERQAAQKAFDKAKKQGKSASLLKQQRPNVFSMNVANIMPEDTIDIKLRYTELLVPTDGTYKFVYPTVVGPRYSSQSEAGAPETDLFVKNPYLKQGSEPRMKFHLDVHISTGLPIQGIFCSSHKTETTWEGKSIARLSLNDCETFGANRDFILDYRLAGRQIESGLMMYEGKDENFFLLMVQPPERVEIEDIPPREYVFVVDVSGSMRGYPLNTAKKLLKDLIGGLRETDKFNLVLFAGASKLMARKSVQATPNNIRRAIRTLDNARGGGGTELSRGLKRSLSIPREEAYSRTIVIVTDGYISAEKEVFSLIQENLNVTNVFSFGIGTSVNRYLIEGMAKAGLGEPFIVTEPEEAHLAANKFREYVQSPVLKQISIQYQGLETYDIEPPSIPDLFAQRPIIVFGKLRGQLQGTIELRGSGGKGPYVQTFDVSNNTPLEMNHALRYLWARTRISRLSDFNFNRGDSENQAQITSLGVTYNLLTTYTSFIAIHDVVRNPEGNSKEVKQPLPLPKGVSNSAVGASCSNVPEPDLTMMLGILIILATLLYFRKLRRESSTNMQDL